MKYVNWLKPGINIKRWVLTGVLGIFLITVGIYPYIGNVIKGTTLIHHALIFFVGIWVICLSIKKAMKSLLDILGISDFSELFHYKLYEKYHLEKGCKIVVIGGGTGLSVILRGLKKVTSNITAIVTTADDGGGSGVLREDLGMLPPGDIRSCILALADTEEDMQELFQYRFKEGRLSGQSFGNLFIAALTGVYDSFEEAVAKVHEILAVKGRVIPVTANNIQLFAELQNGRIIKGESKIPAAVLEFNSPIRKVFLEPTVPEPIEEALTAIKDADIILLGPGSLYTSIIPNLLVKDIVEVISQTKALKIYISNIMTQPGETDRFSVWDHVHAISYHIDEKIIDHIMVNAEKIPEDIFRKYKEDGAEPVIITRKEVRKLKRKGFNIIEGDFVEIKQGYIRHDAHKISNVIMDLYSKKLGN